MTVPAATTATRPPLLLTMGEPAGIGGEIALAAWLRRQEIGAEGGPLATFALIDDPFRLTMLAAELRRAVPIQPIERPEDAAAVFPNALPVLPCPLTAPATLGRPDPANAATVARAIRLAVSLVQAGRGAAIVTNPIHKAAMQAGGFQWPGHTEMLADLAGPGHKSVMMLCCDGLRVIPVTGHVSLRDAVAQMDGPTIVRIGRTVAAELTARFRIARPRLAVAALNPHAGEDGVMGREEIDIIAPAVAQLRAEGIDVFGPAPADSLFHPAARARYDAALCMTHDHALIPLKTIDFWNGVNVTLGLPFIRTSPDHGVALEIAAAGRGEANPDSLIAALRLAGRLAYGEIAA